MDGDHSDWRACMLNTWVHDEESDGPAKIRFSQAIDHCLRWDEAGDLKRENAPTPADAQQYQKYQQPRGVRPCGTSYVHDIMHSRFGERSDPWHLSRTFGCFCPYHHLPDRLLGDCARTMVTGLAERGYGPDKAERIVTSLRSLIDESDNNTAPDMWYWSKLRDENAAFYQSTKDGLALPPGTLMTIPPRATSEAGESDTGATPPGISTWMALKSLAQHRGNPLSVWRKSGSVATECVEFIKALSGHVRALVGHTPTHSDTVQNIIKAWVPDWQSALCDESDRLSCALFNMLAGKNPRPPIFMAIGTTDQRSVRYHKPGVVTPSWIDTAKLLTEIIGPSLGTVSTEVAGSIEPVSVPTEVLDWLHKQLPDDAYTRKMDGFRSGFPIPAEDIVVIQRGLGRAEKDDEVSAERYADVVRYVLAMMSGTADRDTWVFNVTVHITWYAVRTQGTTDELRATAERVYRDLHKVYPGGETLNVHYNAMLRGSVDGPTGVIGKYLPEVALALQQPGGAGDLTLDSVFGVRILEADKPAFQRWYDMATEGKVPGSITDARRMINGTGPSREGQPTPATWVVTVFGLSRGFVSLLTDKYHTPVSLIVAPADENTGWTSPLTVLWSETAERMRTDPSLRTGGRPGFTPAPRTVQPPTIGGWNGYGVVSITDEISGGRVATDRIRRLFTDECRLPSLRRALACVLLLTRVHRDTIKAMLSVDALPPLAVSIVRPFIEHQTKGICICRRGYALGATFYGQESVRKAWDSSRNVLEIGLWYHAMAFIWNPRLMKVVRNIIDTQACRNFGVDFCHTDDDIVEKRASCIARLCSYCDLTTEPRAENEDRGRPYLISATGHFGSIGGTRLAEPREPQFSSDIVYARIHRRYCDMADAEVPLFNDDQGSVRLPFMCHQGEQYVADTPTTCDTVIRGTGPLADASMPGSATARKCSMPYPPWTQLTGLVP
jgi:hypothetical protein